MSKDNKAAWGRYHDITYLYLAMASASGPVSESESRMLLLCMREWKPDMTRAKFAPLYKDVVRRMLKVDSGIKLIRTVEARSAVLAETIGGNRKRAMMMLEHLRKIAEIDGPMTAREQLLLQAAITHLGLGKRVRLEMAHGYATLKLSLIHI